MEERRKNPRIKVTLDLMVSSLFVQDNDKINIDSPINVKDVSRTGIGFVSKSIFLSLFRSVPSISMAIILKLFIFLI